MEIWNSIYDNILPIVIIGFFIYFFLIIATVFITAIRVKKADKSAEHCMTKVGLIVHGIVLALYIAYIIYCIIDFKNRLSGGFLKAVGAFNILTVVTMIYSSFIQDFLIVTKRSLVRGNHLYEFRRIKKVTYPKKHKLAFVYGQKELTLAIRFVDLTKLKKHLVR